jgi:hypothetical protein
MKKNQGSLEKRSEAGKNKMRPNLMATESEKVKKRKRKM